MPNDGPSPSELWQAAGGDGERYRALMLEHGYLIPLKPGEKREPLPCGWPGPVNLDDTAEGGTEHE